MNLKQQVGIEAAKLVKSGMTVGLGTGSTVYYLVEELGRLVQEEGLDFVATSTSTRTRQQGEKLGLTVVDIDDAPPIDLTIDGADEVDPHFNGIKGGGAAHLFEKIVAINSKRNVWIVDESKLVEQLGAFPLPVEVVKFGSQHLFDHLKAHDLRPIFREDESGQKLLTDDGNYIIDLHLERIENPVELASWLSHQVGVVEHGLFLNIADAVIVGGKSGLKVLEKK